MGLAMARLARDVSNLSLASPVLSDPSSNGCHVALCTLGIDRKVEIVGR